MAAMPTKDEVTDHELKLIGAIRKLKVKPEKVETTEDLEHFMKEYDKDGSEKRQFARLSIFFGEDGKGEVTYQTWRYEIQCLMRDKGYSEDQVLLAIRRSAKGEAANILRRLGVAASVGDILRKFNSTFGDIDSPLAILKKFYAVEQGAKESLVTYGARVEELFAQAIEAKAVDAGQEKLLKSVFYQGLRPELRQFGNLKFETIGDYDKFKIEMRKIEEDLEKSTKKDKEKENSAKCNLVNQKSSDMDEVKGLLKEMNDKIKKLEEKQNQQQTEQQYTPQRGRGSYRGPRHYRGSYNRGQSYRGRGQYKPSRPTGAGTFRPANPSNGRKFNCYTCGEEGHMARDCPTLNR